VTGLASCDHVEAPWWRAIGTATYSPKAATSSPGLDCAHQNLTVPHDPRKISSAAIAYLLVLFVQAARVVLAG